MICNKLSLSLVVFFLFLFGESLLVGQVTEIIVGDKEARVNNVLGSVFFAPSDVLEFTPKFTVTTGSEPALVTLTVLWLPDGTPQNITLTISANSTVIISPTEQHSVSGSPPPPIY